MKATKGSRFEDLEKTTYLNIHQGQSFNRHQSTLTVSLKPNLLRTQLFIEIKLLLKNERKKRRGKKKKET